MSSERFFDKLRSFLFGFHQNDQLKNEFRNPIWNTEDDEEVDELYHPKDFHSQLNVHSDPLEFHNAVTKQLQEIMKSFSGLLGDVKTFFPEDNIVPFVEPDMPQNAIETNIRDYYLKPGYQNYYEDLHKRDLDLDGKVSSEEISGLLKKKDSISGNDTKYPFFGDGLKSGTSFFQTVITTSITKPDGTVETRRIIKNDKGVIEEITTTASKNL